MKNCYANLGKRAERLDDAIIRLNEILKILRLDCPWDKVQTHETLITTMIEEAYEAVEAIKKHDFENLREELGDVLLQVLFHSIIAGEKDRFNLVDVINDEADKMIRRHPYIFLKCEEESNFSRNQIKSIDKTVEKWENIKRKEHINVSYCQLLESVPKSLPALMLSQKVQKKASSVGFEWGCIEDALLKIEEESSELMEAYESGVSADIEEELGDLLFSVVNVARFMNIDAEKALSMATDKFIDRFKTVEELAEADGDDLKDLSAEALKQLWEKAKVSVKIKN